MASVLSDLTVLDLSWGTAGPLTTMLLSDYGAEVIKVEPPGGDPFRATSAYTVWNRGKKSVVLNLKAEPDRARFDELVQRADLLVESFSPGTTDRLGISYDRLRTLNSRLIYCSITGYGRHSQWSQRPAYDALVQARTGLQFEQQGWRDGPIFLHMPLPSFGAFFLASAAINAALHAREVTGQGQWVETSLLQGVLAWTTMLWQRVEDAPEGFAAGFTYRDLPGSPCYQAGDGKWFHPMPQCVPIAARALGISPEEIANVAPTQPYEARKAWFEAVRAMYKRRPRDEWVPFMWENDVPCQPVLSVEETFSNPQVLANGVVDEVDIPGIGKVKQFAHPYHLEHSESKIQGPPPALGQHTQEVLQSISDRPLAAAAASEDTRPLQHPLEGIRVLDIGLALAGPYGPMILSDLGAEVIKIENPAPRRNAASGGGISGGNTFLWFACQRGKRCITLNLKTPEGREVLYDLIRSADVLHYNMRMNVAERLGFDYETVKKINPRLIYCHTTAYGRTGPYATFPGVDQMGQALGGIEYEQGATPAGGQPTWYRFGQCDASNAFLSVIAILQALYHRDRTGEGQFVDACIVNGATLDASDAYLLPNGKLGARLHVDKNQTGLGPLYRLYETQTGWICIAAVTEREWESLCRVLGREAAAQDPRFATPAARAEHAPALAALLEPIFRTRTADDWFERLDAAAVPCEISIDTFHTTWYDDPDVLANEWVVKYRHPAYGRTEQFGRLFHFSGTPGKIWGPPPLMGQHTREILQELGYDAAKIDTLRTAGVVYAAGD